MNDTTAPPVRFRRTRRDRVIAGVAGGIGRYLGVDPVIVRIVLAVAAFAGGIGILAYVLAWVIVPSSDDPTLDRGRSGGIGSPDVNRIVGAALVLLALLALGDGWHIGDIFFPLALIALGVWLIVRPAAEANASDDPGDQVPPPPPPPARVAAPAVGTTAVQPSADLSDRRFPTARVTAGLVAVLGGGLGLAAAAGADVSAEAVLLACLALCGAGLVAGAFLGRARALIALAVPLGLALAAVSAVDVPFDGGIGERRHAPDEIAEVEDEYRLGIGEMVLDLRGLDRATLAGGRERIEASVGIGSLQLLLPDDVTVDGDATSHVGEVVVQGTRSGGVGTERRIDIVGAEGAGALELDLRVGLGEVRVG